MRFYLDLVDEADLGAIDQLLTAAQTHTGPVTPLGAVGVGVAERIAEILVPCGVEVKVLTETPRVQGTELTEKPTAVATYLALHPGVESAKVRDLFWPGDQSRAPDNGITRLRKALGETPAGHKWFPKATKVTLVDVGSDWERFGCLVEAADRTQDPGDVAAYLDAALDLIESVPARGANPVLYS
ncbi:MAG: helix-turn-helix domain-containing protein [Lentisphaerae bacterium]|nr:helix-turn-helix domain-containing protein [Lentisphaerota bacterium]